MIVSIIIPIYNVADYIEDCIYSVISQNYNGRIECLLVDDCGTDDSITKAKSFIENTPQNISFRIIRHQSNKGLSCARNTGIKEATGDFLLFLDSDDRLSIDCIKVMTEIIDTYPDTELVQAGVLRSTGEPFSLDFEHCTLSNYITNVTDIKKLLLGRDIPCMAFPRLIRRSFLIDNDLFFRKGVLNEDELWRFYLAKKVSRLAICHNNTYIYTIREGSIMTKKSNTRYDSVLKICDEMLNHIDPICKREQIYMIAQILENTYYVTMNDNYKSELKKMISRCMNGAPVLLMMKLWLFVTFSESHLAKRKFFSYFFYKSTILK